MELITQVISGMGTKIVSFFSLEFLFIFLPFALVLFIVVPKKIKKYALIIESCIFFWLVSDKLIVYLFMTAFSMHYFGIWIDRIQGQMHEKIAASEKDERKGIKKSYIKKQRCIVAIALVVQLGVLLNLKYTGFVLQNINALSSLLKIKTYFQIPEIIAPIGISFFTMQAVSYIFDVYRGVTKADDNFARLLLFISFFPQIVEGPICRYSQTAEALWNVKPIKYDNFVKGILRILYGMMKKVVVADRLDPMIKTVFLDYENYDGGILLFTTVLYTVQLYMDFSGSMDAVIGIAQIFGIEMPENFKRPFFSKSISEFWTRWHITLGTWFRDYVFYPISVTSPMKKITSSARKKIGNHYGPLIAGGISLFCVWLGNGVWHGAGWHFIAFGLYHFVLIFMGSLITPLIQKADQKLNIDKNKLPFKCFRIIRTSILVVFGELIFRAHGLIAANNMIHGIFTDFKVGTLNESLLTSLSVDKFDLIISGVVVLIVFVISILQEKGINVRDVVLKKPTPIRWAIIYLLMLFIIVFGAYGTNYLPVDPIYAQF
ncbi:MAG: MBOAT family protein [Clostridiales bacterium]|nr:MBOAT family protein [Clostridiales bacterium]